MGKSLKISAMAIVFLMILGLLGCGNICRVPAAKENTLPDLDAGPDRVVVLDDTGMFTLSGAESFDPDGDTLSFLWVLVSGPTSTATAVFDSPLLVEPEVAVDIAGDYVFKLTVSDGQNEVEDTVTVTVVIPVSALVPVVDVGPNQVVPVDFLVKVEAICVNRLAGQCTFTWSLSSPAGSSAELIDTDPSTMVFLTDMPGTYTVTVVANNGSSDSLPDTVTVTATARAAGQLVAGFIDDPRPRL